MSPFAIFERFELKRNIYRILCVCLLLVLLGLIPVMAQSPQDSADNKEAKQRICDDLWVGIEMHYHSRSNWGLQFAHDVEFYQYEPAFFKAGVRSTVAGGWEYLSLDARLFLRLAIFRFEAGIAYARFFKYPFEGDSQSQSMGPPSWRRAITYREGDRDFGSSLYYLWGVSLQFTGIRIGVQIHEQVTPSLYKDIEQTTFNWGETTYDEWTEGPLLIRSINAAVSIPLSVVF